MAGAPVRDPFQLVGQILERKYIVERCVAEGGFGVVYAGRHAVLDAPIAIKVHRRTPGATPEMWAEAIARFLTEAKTVAKLRHAAVVNVLDAGVSPLPGQADWVPWMVMEWLDGETLEDHLRARRDTPGRAPADALALLRPVFEALAAAHAAGIAHRDIKGSNVMLVPGPRGPSARVLDFGIAKLIREQDQAPSGHTQTSANMRAFSPGSASPEQVAGTRTGPWTDVHALALLLVELVTHRPPYVGQELQDYFAAVFDPVRPTPAKVGVDVGAWEPVLVRALALKPGERYADASAFLAALEAALPGATPQAGGAKPPHAHARRAPLWGWLVAAGMLAAVGAGIAVARHAESGRAAAPAVSPEVTSAPAPTPVSAPESLAPAPVTPPSAVASVPVAAPMRAPRPRPVVSTHAVAPPPPTPPLLAPSSPSPSSDPFANPR
jgi:serine/threonine protein kinase